MVEVYCPHCDETVQIDTNSGGDFTCPSCEEDFIFEDNENLEHDINDEKKWIQFNPNPMNDIELMNGKSERSKGIRIMSGIVLVLTIFLTLLAGPFGICLGLFAFVWLVGMVFFFTKQDLYFALYYTESNDMVTCVSTDGNGPWYIERKVERTEIQRAELKCIGGGEHGGTTCSLKLFGNNWTEHMDALGLKEDLFETHVGIKIE
jgi:hypothetical protein